MGAGLYTADTSEKGKEERKTKGSGSREKVKGKGKGTRFHTSTSFFNEFYETNDAGRPVCRKVYGRFPESHFPGKTFPG